MTYWPCPPPITTTFNGLLFIQPPLIAMFFIAVILDLIVIIQEIRDRDGAVLAAGTANRYGEVILAFLDIFGKRVIEKTGALLSEKYFSIFCFSSDAFKNVVSTERNAVSL